ncbi:MAG: leucine-rich repeat domain-containing protein [Marinilabiliaceae bacterium]|nr:leucine-rich repeat domain-containing protein [Marinilabiliaceae bacterium]
MSYTLTDDDVTVVNGTITACSYDFSVNTEGTYLTIPSTLDGQTVTAIADGTGDPWTTLTGIFLNKKIKSVTLPSTLTYIGKLAFAQNVITTINFSNELTTIGESAFYQNQLTTLSIPASVVSIRMNAFNENSSLSSVTFEANSHLVMLDSHVFANTAVSSITLPTPIVPDNNFEHWIKIDGSGTTLAGGESVNPSNNAFYAKFVYTLTDADVVVENGILKSCSYDFSSKFINIPSQLDGQTVTEIAGSYSQDKAMFYGKTLMGLTLPASLTKIGDLVFNSNSIQNLTIPANVTYIGQYAFWRSGVKSVTFEENTKIITIDNGAFDNNNGLTMSLPTPVKAGFTFKKWLDGDDTEFAGGATLTNFDTSYEAQFAKATAVENNKAGAMDIFVQNNVLHIATEGQHVLELLDMSGKMILTQSISQDEPVDISHLKAGAYIARISGHDGTITQKVVKM